MRAGAAKSPGLPYLPLFMNVVEAAFSKVGRNPSGVTYHSLSVLTNTHREMLLLTLP